MLNINIMLLFIFYLWRAIRPFHNRTFLWNRDGSLIGAFTVFAKEEIRSRATKHYDVFFS